METSTKTIDLARIKGGTVESALDYVSVEEPLEIQIAQGPNQKIFPVSVTMRTPGNDEELAVGFLFTEGIINESKQVQGIDKVSENVLKVRLNHSTEINTASLARNFYTTSSCGVCGKASIEAIKVITKKVINNLTVEAGVLQNLPAKLLASQDNFQSTGGLHASALFDRDGNLQTLREDVGRHNALDKLIGASFLQNEIPINNSILLVSGRVSFELVQKAAVAGIPVAAAIGAPSSLAIELADENGITLIGFLSSSRFNIYTHQNRVLTHENSRV